MTRVRRSRTVGARAAAIAAGASAIACAIAAGASAQGIQCRRYAEAHPPASRSYEDVVGVSGSLGPAPELADDLVAAFAAQYHEYVNQRVDASKEAVRGFVDRVVRATPWSALDPREKTLGIAGSYLFGVATDAVKGELDARRKAKQEKEELEFFPEKARAKERQKAFEDARARDEAERSRIGQELLGTRDAGAGPSPRVLGAVTAGYKTVAEVQSEWAKAWAEIAKKDAETWADMLVKKLDETKSNGAATWEDPRLWPPALAERANTAHGGLSHRQAEWICDFLARFATSKTVVTEEQVRFVFLRKWLNEGAVDGVGHLTIEPSEEGWFGLGYDPRWFDLRPGGVDRFEDRVEQMASAPMTEVSIGFSGRSFGENLGDFLRSAVEGSCGGTWCPVWDACNARSREATIDEEILGIRFQGGAGLAATARRALPASGELDVDPWCARKLSLEEEALLDDRTREHEITTDDGFGREGTAVRVRSVTTESSVFDLEIPVAFSLPFTHRGWGGDERKREVIVFLPGRSASSQFRWLHYNAPGLDARIAEKILLGATSYRVRDINARR
ncbi:MAG: hypothetical protein R3E88_14535 [Myxococcota bacterium]